MFELEIDTVKTSAFGGNPALEVARILRKLADELDSGKPQQGSLKDRDEITVGQFSLW